MGAHLNEDRQFQSDKYPTTPPGLVPLSVRDPTAQDLLMEYAQRRRSVDAEFSDDLETALREAGYPGAVEGRLASSTPPDMDQDQEHDLDDDRVVDADPVGGRLLVAVLLVASGELVVTQLPAVLPRPDALSHVLLCVALASLGFCLGRPLDRRRGRRDERRDEAQPAKP